MGHQEDIVKTESKIIVIRDTQVILDRDVAELYGVTTKVVNQAIRNNPDKLSNCLTARKSMWSKILTTSKH